jgi:hypothetical protein
VLHYVPGANNDVQIYNPLNLDAFIIHYNGTSTINKLTDFSYAGAFGLLQTFGNNPAVDLNGHLMTLWRFATLDGGAASDTLTGGAGADVFSFSGAPGAGGVDVITDFSVVDDAVRLSSTAFAGCPRACSQRSPSMSAPPRRTGATGSSTTARSARCFSTGTVRNPATPRYSSPRSRRASA